MLLAALQSLDAVSLSGSAVALVTTFYFWLIRSNRERARLESHLVNKAIAQQRDPDDKGMVATTIHARLGVANYSIMPNAILAVSADVRRADGTWGRCEVNYATDTQFFSAGHGSVSRAIFERLENELPAAPPFNLSPMTTHPLPLRLFNVAPASLAPDGKDPIARPLELRFRVHGLSNRSFDSVVRNDEGPWAESERAKEGGAAY